MSLDTRSPTDTWDTTLPDLLGTQHLSWSSISTCGFIPLPLQLLVQKSTHQFWRCTPIESCSSVLCVRPATIRVIPVLPLLPTTQDNTGSSLGHTRRFGASHLLQIARLPDCLLAGHFHGPEHHQSASETACCSST